jgi:hypothetical protein
VEVFANRGTSGIDGCTSTAVGAALQTERIVTLITGDVAFFYDRNGLWHNYLPPNLRVVLLNNHGGGIFRLIDGPAGQPELEEYFETRQPLRADRAAESSGSSTFPAAPAKTCANICPPFSLLKAGPSSSKSRPTPLPTPTFTASSSRRTVGSRKQSRDSARPGQRERNLPRSRQQFIFNRQFSIFK